MTSGSPHPSLVANRVASDRAFVTLSHPTARALTTPYNPTVERHRDSREFWARRRSEDAGKTARGDSRVGGARDTETRPGVPSRCQSWRYNAKRPPPEDDGLSYNPTVDQFRYRQFKWCEADGCRNLFDTSGIVRFFPTRRATRFTAPRLQWTTRSWQLLPTRLNWDTSELLRRIQNANAERQSH